MEKGIIIIPDVHGREFWKFAAEGHEEERIVFLGDYLDPYDDEMVFWEDAFHSLKKIIELKKEHPKNVTLLFGNHDLHYLFTSLAGSRKNEFKEHEIRKIFLDSMECFQMAKEVSLAGKRFLFSHAGISMGWMQMHPDIFPEPEKITADKINVLMFERSFIGALGDVSPYRGGLSPYGSMIWADAFEFANEGAAIPGVEQIFGHTRHLRGPLRMNSHAVCIDCGKAFILNDNGEILPL